MKKSKKSSWSAWISLLFLLAFPACYEEVEGCLDVAAKNFTVDADLICPDDCCVYPSLKLVLNHRVGTPDQSTALVYLDSIYHDAQGQPFRLQLMQYFLSNFELIRPSGESVRVADQIDIQAYNSDGSLSDHTLVDDYLLINPSFSRSLSVGEIKTSGTFEAIRFSLGLDELANATNSNEVTAGHPLGAQEEQMYLSKDQGYDFIKLGLLKDTISTDTIPEIVDISGAANRIDYFLSFGQPFDLNPGFNITLTLHIDYGIWLSSIADIKNDSAEEIAEKTVSGLSQAITLLAITVDNR